MGKLFICVSYKECNVECTGRKPHNHYSDFNDGDICEHTDGYPGSKCISYDTSEEDRRSLRFQMLLLHSINKDKD